MVYLISGEDTFRSSQYLKTVKEFYSNKKTSFFTVDFTDSYQANSLKDIRDFFGKSTLFQPLKLIVLKDVFQLPAPLQKELSKILEDKDVFTRKDIMVVLYERGTIKKNIPKGEKKEFPFLKGRKLLNWIQEQENKLNVHLTTTARSLLANSFPQDSGSIYNILEELSCSGEKLIDQKYLEDNVNLPLPADVFAMLDAIVQKDIAQALILEKKKLFQGEKVLRLLGMIVMEFRTLLKIKTTSGKSREEIRKKTGLNYYHFLKTYPLAQHCSESFLQNGYRYLLQYDRKIKRGILEGDLALDLLLLDISALK